MHIGEIIREHRKNKNMTQEEMANRLGVTTPAVNKWENGVSQPDIMLLTPIARLLNITLDTLLSFQEELTPEGMVNIVRELDSHLKETPYEEAFQWAKENIEQYPNCEQLIWQLAIILDSWRSAKHIPNSEKYDDYINDCYVRALNSNDESIKRNAADSLFGFYLRKEQYQKAEEYLDYFSPENPEKKRKQAIIYSQTNRKDEAYKAYEELLFSGYQRMNLVFHDLYLLTTKDNNYEKAHMLVEKQSKLASVFDMGKYNESLCRLELATLKKDVDTTLMTAENLLENLESICSFIHSSLYAHMEFKEISSEFAEGLHADLLDFFRDNETYDYMKDCDQWTKLINSQFTQN